jgi:hypothetical protein
VHLVGAELGPVRTEHGLTICADTSFDSAPALDIICVPGGPGVDAMMENEILLQFLQSRAPSAKYVTAVCTGALVLGAESSRAEPRRHRLGSWVAIRPDHDECVGAIRALARLGARTLVPARLSCDQQQGVLRLSQGHLLLCDPWQTLRTLKFFAPECRHGTPGALRVGADNSK